MPKSDEPLASGSAHPDRRSFLQSSATLLGATTLAAADQAVQAATQHALPPIRRIATEEAFTTPALAKATASYLAGPGRAEESALIAARAVTAPSVRDEWGRRLPDFGELRRSEMDRAGIAMQILLASSPGVQLFDREQAVELARLVNDEVAQHCRADPKRYAALATIAPQDPKAAADEFTRAVKSLGFCGALINSHTKGEYLDDPKFWPIFEVAQALDLPIYLHPREPAPAMIAPFVPPRLTGSIWGFAAETGLHALRMIFGHVFENFPRLQIILGHAGEALPFFVDRIDTRYAAELAPNATKPLRQPPSYYLRKNFLITTSGMNWTQPVNVCLDVMGADRIMFAADWPFENAVEATRTFDAIPMESGLRRKLYETNARRIFKLYL